MLFHEERKGTGVNISHTCSHHKSLGRSEPHGGVHAFAIEHCGYRAAVAHMACDDFLCVDIHPEDFAYARRHIAVACAVETVAAHAVFLIEAVGEGIHK